MSLKHGTLALPTGVSASGIIINEVSTEESAVKIIEKNESGVFEPGNGKVLSVETKLSISGKLKDTASLPATGSGAYTAASPMIDNKRVADKNEGAAEFSIGASFEEEVLEDF